MNEWTGAIDHTIDARSIASRLPELVSREVKRMPSGTFLEVTVVGERIVHDLTMWSVLTGNAIVARGRADASYRLILRRK